jgi:hypothetical protein
MQRAQSEHPEINDFIRNEWHRLTDEEVKAYQEYRDIFFLAVRKKHGIPRAQAELILSNVEHRISEAA